MTVRDLVEKIQKDYSYVKITTNQGTEILDVMDYLPMLDDNGIADMDYDEFPGKIEGYGPREGKIGEIIAALKGLDQQGLLGYIGQGLAEFLAREPDSETAQGMEDWAEGVVDIEEALGHFSLCTSDYEAGIEDWIANEDREHFVRVYCPSAAAPKITVRNPWSGAVVDADEKVMLEVIRGDIKASTNGEDWQRDFDGFEGRELIEEYERRYREHGVDDILSIRYFS